MTTNSNPTPHRPDEPTLELEHAMVGPEDAPSECVLFPTAATDLGQETNWIVAHGDSFVDLPTMR